MSDVRVFENVTAEQFLGNPVITTAANARDLQPDLLRSHEGVAREPFHPQRNDPGLTGLTAVYTPTGAAVLAGDKVVASYHFGDTLVVARSYRRRGIGSELVYQFRLRYPETVPARSRTKASQALQIKVWERITRELAQARRAAEATAYVDTRTSITPLKAPDNAQASTDLSAVASPPAASPAADVVFRRDSADDEFLNWFALDGAADQTGRPLRLFHGSATPHGLTDFIPGGTIGSRQTGDAYGIATYFTTSASEASLHAHEAGAVFPVYVRGKLLDIDADLAAEESATLTALANAHLLPSDKARFECGRERRSFHDRADAIAFFDAQRANWKQFGDGMDRARPEATVEEANATGKYVVEFTNFDAVVPIRNGQDAYTLFRAIGWDNVCAAGYDGVVMRRGGSAEHKWVMLHRPAGNVRSALDPSRPFRLPEQARTPQPTTPPSPLAGPVAAPPRGPVATPAPAFDFSEPPAGYFSALRETRRGATTISFTVHAAEDGGAVKLNSLRTPAARRGAGSARAVMHEFLAAADRASKLVVLGASPLDQRTRLPKLVAFYRSLGFEPTGRSINPLGHPEMARRPVHDMAPDAHAATARDPSPQPDNGPAALAAAAALSEWKRSGGMVDSSGHPRRFFHGTEWAYAGFLETDRGTLHFTDDPDLASRYAMSRPADYPDDEGDDDAKDGQQTAPDEPAPNVRPVFLSALKLFDPENIADRDALGGLVNSRGDWETLEYYVPAMRRLGYDGILVDRTRDVAVFSPDQVTPAFAPPWCVAPLATSPAAPDPAHQSAADLQRRAPR